MNGPLFDDLLDQLHGAPARELGQRLGVQPDAAVQAAATALPVLFGAMARNARSPGRAESLLSALEFDHRGIDPHNALSTALAGGGMGGAILQHLFGSRHPAASDAVGDATGLGGERGGILMRALAPVVMAYLARRLFTPREADGASTPEPSPDGLRTALDQEMEAVSQRPGAHHGLLAMLDRDHDGDVDPADLTGVRAGMTADDPVGDAAGVLPVQTAEMRSPRPRI